MKIGIADFECKVVKNAKKRHWDTVPGRRVFGQLALPFLLKPVRKPPRAFGIFVEGNLLGNIGIQSLDHLYFENWRNFECKWVKRNC
jgi:hypothetical protein